MKIVNLPAQLTTSHATKALSALAADKQVKAFLATIAKAEKDVLSIQWKHLITSTVKPSDRDEFMGRYQGEVSGNVAKAVSSLDLVTDMARAAAKPLKADKATAKTAKAEIAYLEGVPKLSYAVHTALVEGEKGDRKEFEAWKKEAMAGKKNPFAGLGLNGLLQDKKLRVLFYSYAKKEFSTENLDCLAVVLRASSRSDADLLFNEFVRPGASKQVNVPAKSLKLFQELGDPGAPDAKA